MPRKTAPVTQASAKPRESKDNAIPAIEEDILAQTSKRKKSKRTKASRKKAKLSAEPSSELRSRY